MIPLSQALLLASYPKSRAGTALAMWSITTLVAPVVGPVLGGWITDNISWPWIFYINVPVGIGAAIATWAIYLRRETPTARVPVDAVGLGLLMIWVGALQGHARQGQGPRLVQLGRDRDARLRDGGVICRVPHLGADRGASDRRPVAVPLAQFLGEHRRDAVRLRAVLR